MIVNTIQNENTLEHSGLKDTLDELKDASSHGCVDGRIAVPGQLRPAVLKRIHRGHPGYCAYGRGVYPLW